jgi:hypothetical protein
MAPPPPRQLIIHDFLRTEDRLFLSIHPYSYKIRLVDIQPDPPLNIGRFCHEELLVKETLECVLFRGGASHTQSSSPYYRDISS